MDLLKDRVERVSVYIDEHTHAKVYSYNIYTIKTFVGTVDFAIKSPTGRCGGVMLDLSWEFSYDNKTL